MNHPFVILTDKPGHFHTEICDGLEPVERFDYYFAGRRRAHFVIARLLRPVRVPLVENEPPYGRNLVPSKFLPQFASVDEARRELEKLVAFGNLDTQLRRLDGTTPGFV